MPAPTSTYRLQLSPAFTLHDAAALVSYLEALGVGALHASPLLAAAPGSTHGYDVVDPTRVSDALGGEAGRRELVDALRAAGVGLVVDIVPNHMGVADAAANPWWWDVLAQGRASRFASYFDIDWGRGPVLIPVLDADEEGALDELKLAADGAQLRYHELAFPVAPGTGAGTPREVHERQHYRLAATGRGAAELGYRRFFDVSTLAAVRVEEPEVFDAVHREVLRWVAAGEVDGLRVDHPDGLTAPGEYFRRLRGAVGGSGWLLAEKVLAVGESLPPSWPVDGTTGYDALREVSGVFVDPAGAGLLTQLAAELTGERLALSTVTHQSRRLVADTILAAEVHRIAELVPHVPPEVARDAVAELLSSFPTYRSYLPEGRAALDTAVDTARAHRPDLASVLEAMQAAMLAEPHGPLVARMQQSSGMVMAKGVEDTAFYRWTRFTGLNEVGGAPDRFGVSPAELHAAAQARHSAWPHTMTTLSTHDTKRAEDVRARLAVLSELPAEWAAVLRRWVARNPLPEPSLELLAWQSLVGAWPINAGRLRDYLLKAAKEAKLVTSHVEPVPAVDAAIAAWPRQVLHDGSTVAELAELLVRVAPPGWSNSLGQKLLQLAGPGVPDVYQGTEFLDYSLVDPDNRRPVDFAARRASLAKLDGGWLPRFPEAPGATKLLVTSRALRLRRGRPELFTGYRPLPAEGPAAAEHAIAFARSPSLVAVATRLPVGLAARGGWGDTVLPLPGGAADWTDVITGRPVDSTAPRLAELLDRYPVALIARPV